MATRVGAPPTGRSPYLVVPCSSTDPMIVDSDTVSLGAFPTNVVVYDEPPPREYSGGSTVTEVLVINSEEHPDGRAQDPLEDTLRDLTAPIPEDADAEVLEARHLQLVESAGRLASMRCLSEAYRREMDQAVGLSTYSPLQMHVGR